MAPSSRQMLTEGIHFWFSQNDHRRGFLLSTGDTVLVKANAYDRIWGIGLHADDERAIDPAKWRRQNLLGIAFMDVRERLRSAGC